MKCPLVGLLSGATESVCAVIGRARVQIPVMPKPVGKNPSLPKKLETPTCYEHRAVLSFP